MNGSLDHDDDVQPEAGDPSGTPRDPSAQDETAPSSAPDAKAPSPDDDPAVLRDRWLRARAELENVRRRARLDVDEARRYGNTSLLLALLPVVDTLQRALDTAPDDTPAAFIEGLRLTEQQFLITLESHGVTPFAVSAGDVFDPTRHRALLEHPTDAHAPGTVVHELVRGYMIHDRLLREAQVAVAKAPAPPSDG